MIPTVKIETTTLSSNYYTRAGDKWMVSTLIQYCKEQEYPTYLTPLASLDLNFSPWDLHTLQDFIHHAKRCNDASLEYPIILDDRGCVCDGYHRLCKAIIEGKTEIACIRIQDMPVPDGKE